MTHTAESAGSPLLRLCDVHTHFHTFKGVVRAVNGIDLELNRGEMLGIVGETGSGKSVLIRSILNLVKFPGKVVRGEILFNGEDLLRKSEREMRRLRGKEISLIVTNPKGELNPLIPVGEQIRNVILDHQDVTASDAEQRALALIDAVGIADPKRLYRGFPHELSGGMAQRIVIAMALANSPAVILADEPTAGLDVTIQTQVLDLMRDLLKTYKSATLMVTRDLGIVAHYCNRVAVIYAGQVMETADVRAFFRHAYHPYSRFLLTAAFAARGAKETLAMAGAAPDLTNLPSGCLIQDRCQYAEARCREQAQSLEEFEPGHFVRCWKAAAL